MTPPKRFCQSGILCHSVRGRLCPQWVGLNPLIQLQCMFNATATFVLISGVVLFTSRACVFFCVAISSVLLSTIRLCLNFCDGRAHACFPCFLFCWPRFRRLFLPDPDANSCYYSSFIGRRLSIVLLYFDRRLCAISALTLSPRELLWRSCRRSRRKANGPEACLSTFDSCVTLGTCIYFQVRQEICLDIAFWGLTIALLLSSFEHCCAK